MNTPPACFTHSGYWNIINQDGVDMPVGAAFNVLVLVPSIGCFCSHGYTPANSLSDFTKIDQCPDEQQPEWDYLRHAELKSRRRQWNL